ncbi:hypothetical protein [Pseudomonas sp. BN411]|uniref:hypothetical protein n=1 Tax=Pseudomonas sp. BN411 TaxID=2567887 RepID=UPI0024540D78|nr:hypothetical protein [Pseudomonas sp. BN411]
MGILLAGLIGTSGKDAPLALVGPGFSDTAEWLGLIVFALVCIAFCRHVLGVQRANLFANEFATGKCQDRPRADGALVGWAERSEAQRG